MVEYAGPDAQAGGEGMFLDMGGAAVYRVPEPSVVQVLQERQKVPTWLVVLQEMLLPNRVPFPRQRAIAPPVPVYSCVPLKKDNSVLQGCLF